MKIQQHTAKKGQFTLFIALGVVLLIAVIIIFLAFQQDSTAREITQIESLEDARVAVESCITETIDQNIQSFGVNGGYTTENQYTFSQFNTSYELLSLTELQGNLETGIERSLSGCGSIIENTPYTLSQNGRINLQVEFGEEIKITGNSLGMITTSEGTQSTTVKEIDQRKAINMLEIYSLMESFLASEGIPIVTKEGYTINTFTNEDYTETLIEIYQNEPFFLFRITKEEQKST